MRCCASYRISFHLYQSGLLGRVPQPVPRGNSLTIAAIAVHWLPSVIDSKRRDVIVVVTARIA